MITKTNLLIPSNTAYPKTSRFGNSSKKFMFSTAPLENETLENAATLSAGTIDDKDPVELYQNVKDSLNTQNIKSATVVNGYLWDDQILADWIGMGKDDVSIDTSNPINWAATGNETLTNEQITHIKNKYNISNLNPQDFYNLMSDLTNWDILSAEDVTNMFLTEAPPISDFGILMRVDNAPTQNTKSYAFGNILEKLTQNIDYFQWVYSYSKTSEFSKLNSDYLQSSTLKPYQDYLQRQIEYHHNMLSIFNQLK